MLSAEGKVRRPPSAFLLCGPPRFGATEVPPPSAVPSALPQFLPSRSNPTLTFGVTPAQGGAPTTSVPHAPPAAPLAPRGIPSSFERAFAVAVPLDANVPAPARRTTKKRERKAEPRRPRRVRGERTTTTTPQTTEEEDEDLPLYQWSGIKAIIVPPTQAVAPPGAPVADFARNRPMPLPAVAPEVRSPFMVHPSQWVVDNVDEMDDMLALGGSQGIGFMTL